MTAKAAQHTPGPWHYTNEPNAKRARGKFLTVFRVGDPCPICDVNRHRGEAEANAAFIVRACNSHEELLAALQALEKAATTFTVNCNCQTAGQDDALSASLEIARAAIASATA